MDYGMHYPQRSKNRHLRFTWFLQYTYMAVFTHCDLEVWTDDGSFVAFNDLAMHYSSGALTSRAGGWRTGGWQTGGRGLDHGVLQEARITAMQRRMFYIQPHVSPNGEKGSQS